MVCLRSCVLGLFALSSLASAALTHDTTRSASLSKRDSLITEITSSTSSIKSLTTEVLGVIAGDDVSLETISSYLATVVNTVETLASEVVTVVDADVVDVVVEDVAKVVAELLTAVDSLVVGLLGEVDTITGLGPLVAQLEADLASPLGQILTGLEGVLSGVLSLVGNLLGTVSGLLKIPGLVGLVGL